MKHVVPPIEAHRPMSNDEYRIALGCLKLTHARAGLFLGIGHRTSQGYAIGEAPVPVVIAKLLRLMVDWGIRPDQVR
jgi:hypothetical protein